VPDAAVGPYVRAQPPGLRRAFQHRAELRPADPGHHPGGAHRAGPDPDLDDVRARLDQVGDTGCGDNVAGHDERAGAGLPDPAQRGDHLLLVAVSGVDHDQVSAGVQQQFRLRAGVAVHADRGGHPQPPRTVQRRAVQRGAQRTGPGQDADTAARFVDDRGQPVPALVQQAERVLRVGPGGHGHRLRRHDLAKLGEAVHALAVGLGDHPDRLAILDDDDGTVRALGQ